MSQPVTGQTWIVEWMEETGERNGGKNGEGKKEKGRDWEERKRGGRES